MTLETPDSLKSVDRTPSMAHLMKGAAGAGAAGTGGRSFAQLLNSQRKIEMGGGAGGAAGGVNGASPGTAAVGANSSRHALESAAFELNHQEASDPAAKRHAEVEKAAEGLVSNALILPILKQVRRSMESENSVFSGGNGEKTFGPEFDMQLADRIAKSPRLGVKNALVQRMEKRNGLKPAAASKHVTKNSTLDVHG